jgi:RNA polymerase sigma-70 factor (ECF subfamily)
MWDVSDEALFAGYASGDPDAAAMFVSRVERKVFGLALAIVRDPTDAHDVAQEAFVRAWRFAAGFDARRGSVVAWLLGITRNVALDNVRGRGRRAEPVGDVPDGWPGDGLSPDVGEVVGTRDDAARVMASLQALPEGQRDALVAVTLLGLSTREVSERDGIPHGTVKTRVRLGLRKLRSEMGDRVRWP